MLGNFKATLWKTKRDVGSSPSAPLWREKKKTRHVAAKWNWLIDRMKEEEEEVEEVDFSHAAECVCETQDSSSLLVYAFSDICFFLSRDR